MFVVPRSCRLIFIAHEWWELYGAELPELQRVAMKVLSKRSSACSVERLWSLFGRVWSDARASLGPRKARDLVMTGSNIRLKNKLLAMDYEAAMRSRIRRRSSSSRSS